MKRVSKGDAVFLYVAYIVIIFIVVVTLYPMIYVLSCSISSPTAVVTGQVWLWPKGFSLAAYKSVLHNKDVWFSYGNTIWYVVVGTFINMVFTFLSAYPLSRKQLKGRNVVMMFFAFTMFFGGGLIPTYLIIQKLGLVDTRWALVLPSAIATYNLIMVRTFIQAIPEELHEAAKIDGSNEWSIFSRVVIPLSKPIIAVMVLFYAVAHWNTYFSALIYLNRRQLYPLQMILREILIQLEVTDQTKDEMIANMDMISQTVRYATIIVSTVPILCLYPFLQKYFVKGVMIGAIKG